MQSKSTVFRFIIVIAIGGVLLVACSGSGSNAAPIATQKNLVSGDQYAVDQDQNVVNLDKNHLEHPLPCTAGDSSPQNAELCSLDAQEQMDLRNAQNKLAADTAQLNRDTRKLKNLED
ncbi:MAG: hypothetical protein WB565_10295 [Acidimicrobiales bacterium]